MHPARTIKNAVTPRPVKQVGRAAYTVRHPIGAVENKAIGAVLYPRRAHRPRKRSLWEWLTGRAVPAQPAVGKVAPPASAARPRPAVQAWPPRQAFRSPPPSVPPVQSPRASQPYTPGDWELETRRRTGLGDGSRQ
jgi:hypothetical protein